MKFNLRSIIVKPRFIFYAIGLVMLCSGTFVCTIQDDLGSLANPSAPQDEPTQQGPEIPVKGTPLLFASLDSLYVSVGDTMDITITLWQDTTITAVKQPITGDTVKASASAGNLSSNVIITDNNGRARVQYWHTTEDENVQITFEYQGVSRVIRFDVTDTPVKIQKLIKVLPEKSSIKADAKDFTYVNVTVIDSNHNPIAGQPIQFITSAGIIGGVNPPSEEKAGQSITDANGTARAKLTSTNINDTAFITVYLAGDLNMSDETQVAFQGVSISLSTDSSNLKLGGTTWLTAHLRNASNEPIANTPIFFSLGNESLSNLSFQSGTVDSMTGFDGIARAFISGDQPGTDTITVRAAGTKAKININVTDLILDVALYPNIIQARRENHSELTVKFNQNDGTPLPNKRVEVIRHYKSKEGSAISDTLVGTTHASGDSIGQCSFIISALPYEGTIRLEITAINNAQEVATAETSLECVTRREMTIYALPSVIQADGTSKSLITVQIKNEDNNPIVGDVINFITDVGMVPSSAETNQEGKASIHLTSDRRNAIATVTATLANDLTKTASIQVEFAGVEVSAAANPQSINSSGQDTSTIRLTLTDAMNNPIVGERFDYRRQQEQTVIVPVDSITDNRGEATFKVVGTGIGPDTITFESAGASAKTVVYYSSRYLLIDTVPAAGVPHSYVANGADSTLITVTYIEGDGTTPISGAQAEVSITLGDIPGQSDTLFVHTGTTAADGKISFYMRNPNFANYATIAAKASKGGEITSKSIQLYFKADLIKSIKLSGTPEVISTNGDRAKITAIAYDNEGNRVNDATISFNLISGPGGGEFLDPPTAITGADGKATTYLISGSIPSMYRDIWIVAGDFTSIKSDTVKFTIAGPPHYITIRRDIGEIVDNKDGTYTMNVAAIVSDINGNPVADGTEVTFTAKIIGYCIYKLIPDFSWNTHSVQGYWHWWWEVDTVRTILPFEDMNDNYRLDNGEDKNRDGFANRGEDVNGNGVFQPGPGFEDINWNGIRDSFPEPAHGYVEAFDGAGNAIWDTVYLDLNANGKRDIYEPLKDPNMTEEEYRDPDRGYDSTLTWGGVRVTGGYPDIDWNQNGIPDPATAVTIERTIQTENGIAQNELVYGQSDALRIQISLSAESQGIVTVSPDEFILPILLEDVVYWRYRP
ncbi:MAG: hypothetical protein GF401_17425 [Chitinivibrionales bacterium]|nr:hypothetical protein [Chitinivibrionales bacterium]